MSLFSNIEYLDFHTHRRKRMREEHIREIISLHLGEEKDYEYYTIGNHPWWTEDVLSPVEKDTLRKYLAHENCLALGEVGLDTFKGATLDIQMEILRSQLDLARELEMPVIIHCVRAFEALLQIKKEYPEIKNWCIHGYTKNETLARQLIDKGFYLSLMPVMKMTEKHGKLLQSLPLDRFFLETDDVADISIENIYLQTANVLGISSKKLQAQIIQNAELFFQK